MSYTINAVNPSGTTMDVTATFSVPDGSTQQIVVPIEAPQQVSDVTTGLENRAATVITEYNQAQTVLELAPAIEALIGVSRT
jgi:dihydrodipicolinate reductase